MIAVAVYPHGGTFGAVIAVTFGKVTWVEALMADVMLIPFKNSSVS